MARWGRKSSEGRALLETRELIFRGEFRLVIPFRDMKSVSAKDGELRVAFSEGTAVFELGPLATKWLENIENPKSVIDKLGVKPGMAVSVVGIDDAGFLRDLRARVGATAATPRKGSDLVFFGVAGVSALARLAKLCESIRPAGAIWAVWPKGRAELKEDHVRAAAIRAGLVDVKVVAFSATHSALKLVIPVAKR